MIATYFELPLWTYEPSPIYTHMTYDATDQAQLWLQALLLRRVMDLLEKGVITQQRYEEIRKMISSEDQEAYELIAAIVEKLEEDSK